MSAVLRTDDDAPPRLAPMRPSDLDAVLAIEAEVYPFAWTRGNFIDSLVAGYDAQLLRGADGALWAYSIAMRGVDEMHLLNLTVAPALQHRGHARRLLDRLVANGRSHGAQWLWLEVRQGNERARAVYERYGFAEVGSRRGYYPAPGGEREDACVMRLPLAAAPPAGQEVDGALD